MKILVLICAVVLALAGCTTKSKAKLQAREAYVAGQQRALNQMQEQRQGATGIQVNGDVKNTFLPWQDDLTLSQAIVLAEYLGHRDPVEILVTRQGQTFSIKAKDLLHGRDEALQIGDRIEIR